ncbi:MAG: hypothetical protein VB855_00260 [Pirellulaceae bacterium]
MQGKAGKLWSRHRSPRGLRGMTMLELLVVIVIIMLLLAVFAPLIRGTSRDRRVREASRALSGYINGARTLAARRGRPVGIGIERIVSEQPVNGLYATEVYTVEVPLPYSGITAQSRAQIVSRPVDSTNPALGNRWEIDFFETDPAAGQIPDLLIYHTNPLRALIAPGESFWIRLDYRGPIYRAFRVPGPPTSFAFVLDISYPAAPPPPNYAKISWGVPFQLYRHPVRSSAEPLRLPVNTAIDLSVSGFGANGIEFTHRGLAPPQPVQILFNPAGDLEAVYADLNGNGVVDAVSATSSIHLMVGRARQVVLGPGRSVFVDDLVDTSNIMDMSALWLTISHRTGQVTTTENASPWWGGLDGGWGTVGVDDNGNGTVDDVGERGWTGTDDVLTIFAARQFARGKITTGGR